MNGQKIKGLATATLLTIVFGVLGFGFLKVSINIFSQTRLCHEWPPTEDIRSGPEMVAKNDKMSYAMVFRRTYRSAIGICAFPDGGRPITVSHSIDFYRYNLDTGILYKMDSFNRADFSKYLPLADDFKIDSFEFQYKTPDKVYGEIISDTPLKPRVFFAINTASDEVSLTPPGQYKSPQPEYELPEEHYTKKVPPRDNFLK